jgi:predicted nucleic acid-binding protein
MSYEEYVNGEAMELTEESVVEEVPAEAPVAEAVETTETVEAVEPTEAEAAEEAVAEPVAEEAIELVDAEVVVAADATVAEEAVAAEDEFVIQYSVEEPLTEPTVDESLFEAAAEEEFDFAVEAEEAKPCDPFQAKCDELRSVCRDTVQRISKDLKETNYNPYIRSTTTYRYEILKKSTDAEPIDVFEFQRTSGYSLRAMAITAALTAAADIAVGKFLKKRMKK